MKLRSAASDSSYRETMRRIGSMGSVGCSVPQSPVPVTPESDWDWDWDWDRDWVLRTMNPWSRDPSAPTLPLPHSYHASRITYHASPTAASRYSKAGYPGPAGRGARG